MRVLLPYLITLGGLALALTGLGYPSPDAGAVLTGLQTAFHVEPYLQLPAPDGMTIMWETATPMVGRVEYGRTLALGSVAVEKTPAKLHQVRLSGLEAGTSYRYRVRCGDLVSKVNVLKTAPPPGTTQWRMALYGDSRSIPWMHRKVVEQVAKHDVDLILHTGDIVTDGRNYDSWRKEFFAPLAPIAGSVPWVSTIGNHEQDSANYFSYMALPGNERHFGFDYANAHIVCLDSNGWLEKDGRDKKQRDWMEKHFRAARAATWTFVAFHHPLFSAHEGQLGRGARAISPHRWDWAPLFLDPACRVDAVLSGHDHFYARNRLMSRIGVGPSRGVLFMTSAGGGAPLYRCKERDYIAKALAVHHFTLFDFDGDQVTITPIDVSGKVFDRFVLTKEPTPPEEQCAYEIEELRSFLRKALAAAPPVVVAGYQPQWIDASLEVPTRFEVPVKGLLRWQPCPGWEMREPVQSFTLKPKEPLRIPLQAEVQVNGLGGTPCLTIEFEAGRFRNRTIDVYPFKLTGPSAVAVTKGSSIILDGKQDEQVWRQSQPCYLLPTTVGGLSAEPGSVRLATDGRSLLLSAKLADPGRKVVAKPATRSPEASSLALFQEHVRLEVEDGGQLHLFAVTADQLRYTTRGGKEANLNWQAAISGGDGFWRAEIAVPLSLFVDRSKLRLNVIHRSQAANRVYEMRPGFSLGQNPDLIPDWLPPEQIKAKPTAHFAQLLWQ